MSDYSEKIQYLIRQAAIDFDIDLGTPQALDYLYRAIKIYSPFYFNPWALQDSAEQWSHKLWETQCLYYVFICLAKADPKSTGEKIRALQNQKEHRIADIKANLYSYSHQVECLTTDQIIDKYGPFLSKDQLKELKRLNNPKAS